MLHDDNNDNVDGLNLRLLIAATNRPIVHPTGYTWEWRTVVEWYRQEKIPDSSTRTLCQSYQQGNIVTKQEKLAKQMMNLALRTIFVHTSKDNFTCRKILGYAADGFSSPPKEDVRRILPLLETHRTRLGLNPQTLGSMASTINITPPRTKCCMIVDGSIMW
jgi:hypothetical protein